MRFIRTCISWWTLRNQNFAEFESYVGMLEKLWKNSYIYVDTEFNKNVR
jgi:hypothetical protein